MRNKIAQKMPTTYRYRSVIQYPSPDFDNTEPYVQ